MQTARLTSLWRLSAYDTLDGLGGLYADGRWHSQGVRIVYTAESAAGALLELRVHLEVDEEDLPDRYQLLEIALPPGFAIESLDPATLPKDWTHRPDVSAEFGMTWLTALRSPALRVPSAILPATWNVLLNPAHPAIGGLRVVRKLPLEWDRRLFR